MIDISDLPVPGKEFDISDLPVPPKPKASMLGTLGHRAEESALPTAGGALAGAGVGAGLGFIGAGPIGATVGSIAGALVGGAALSAAQEKFLKSHPKIAEKLGLSEEQKKAEEEQYPITSTVGELAPGLLLARPSLTAFKNFSAETAKHMAVNAGLQGGIEAGQQAVGDQPMDYSKIALNTAAGALGMKETALGRKLNGAFTPKVQPKVEPKIEHKVEDIIGHSIEGDELKPITPQDINTIVPKKEEGTGSTATFHNVKNETSPKVDISDLPIPPTAQPPVLPNTEGIVPKEGRNEQVVLAAKALEQGKITRSEYDEYVNAYKPIEPVEAEKIELPSDPERMVADKYGVNKDKRHLVGLPIAEGEKVGLRMDVPALKRGTPVVSIHEGNSGLSNVGKVMSFQPTGYIKDVSFETRNQEKNLKVATQNSDKSPLQTMEGSWINETPDNVYSRIQDIIKNPDKHEGTWTQVGLDPNRHGYFYDKATGEPVVKAKEALQVGRFVLAKDVEYAPKSDFLYMANKVTPEEKAFAEKHLTNPDQEIVHQEGDMGLIRGNSDNGNPLYVPFKGKYRSNYDITDPKNNTFLNKPEIEKLTAIKNSLQKNETDLHAANPDKINFDKGRFQFSPDVPHPIRGVLDGWSKLLGIDTNIYVGTVEHTLENKAKFTGPQKKIVAGAANRAAHGTMGRMEDGNYFINFKKGTSKTKMLEVLAHEIGHVHMYEKFDAASPELKNNIIKEFNKWLSSHKESTAKELVESQRAKTTGKNVEIPEGLKASEMDPKFYNFKEWYADQVARWATTQEKPLNVVERFFKKLGDAMRRFFTKAQNQKYLPNETFMDYLDKVTGTVSNHVMLKKQFVKIPKENENMMGSIRAIAPGISHKIEQATSGRKLNKEGLSHVDANWAQMASKYFAPEKKTIFEKIDGMKDRFWQRVAQGLADKFRTVKEYSHEGYVLSRLAKTVDGALEGLLFHGQVKEGQKGVGERGSALDIDTTKKGLFKALAPLGDELDSFNMWRALNREADLGDKQSKFNDMPDLLAGRHELAEGNMPDGRDRATVYKQANDDLNALNKSVLDIAFKKGLIDEKAYLTFASDGNYVPLYREMGEDLDGAVSAARTYGGLGNQYFSKDIKGGSKPYGDLLENMLTNWSHILSATQKNEALRITLEDAQNNFNAVTPALKVQYDMVKGKVYDKATGDLVNKGTPEEGKLKASMTMDPKGTNKIAVMIDGHKAYYQVHDSLLLDSVAAISNIGSNSKFLNVARDLKNMLQYGVTVSPPFKIRNLFRDSVTSMAVSPLKLNEVYKGWALSEKNNPAHISALAGGGIFNFGTAFEGNQSGLIRKLIEKGVPQNTILTTQEEVKSALTKAWRYYEDLGNRSEAANRVALYNQLKNNGMSHTQASFQARDLLDFSMHGSWPAFRLLTQTVPFLNARVQGLYKIGKDGITPTVRVFYNHINGKPLDLTDLQKAQAFSTVTMASVAATLALYAAFKDDPDFQAREEWDRDNFWWFKLPGMEHALRVPRPFEIGAFSTMAERVAEQLFDEGAEGKQFEDAMSRMVTDTFALNLPQFIKPAVDLYANRDSFTGSPIESSGMEKLSKQERIADTTSPLAIGLGNLSSHLPFTGEGLSPVQVDYAIKAYFGWLGGTVTDASKYAVMPFKEGAYPNTNWEDKVSLGFIKSLPADQSKYVTSFYQNSQQINQAYADMRHFAEIGQSDKVQKILEEKGDLIGLEKFYDKTSKSIAKVRKQIHVINNDPDMSGEDKKMENDRLKQIIAMLAEQAETTRKSLKR